MSSDSPPPRRGPFGPEIRRVLRHYAGVAGVRRWHLAVPALLALLIAAVEGGSFALLIPLTDGMAANDFDVLDGSSTFGWVARLLPDAAANSPSRDAYLAILIIGLIFAGRVAKLSLEYVRKLYLDLRNERYQVRIKRETFARVLRFGRQYFDRQALGRVDTEVGWSSSVVELLAAAEGLFLNVVRLAAKIVLMVAISIPLSLSILIAFPLIRALLSRIHRSAVTVATEGAEVERRMRTEILDLLATIPLVKAFSQEDEAASAYGEILEESRGIQVRRQRLRHLKNPVEEGVVLLGVLVAQGLTLWWASDFQPGDLARFGAFLLVAQQCMPDYMAFSNFRLRMFEQVPLLEALATLFNDDGKHMVPSGPRRYEGLREGIEIRGLTFGYRADAPVLRDVDATIQVGEITAIVGETGAGKTSLVDLVARFYDCPPATVFVDGVDIRDVSLPSLHARMAMVSQDVWLLNRSVRDNLTFGLAEVPPDEVLLEGLAEVELAEFVAGLRGGLDAVVGDRGVRMSGGQRQRLALARALLRDPDILILDEATSALDSVVERRIEEAIERKVRGRTLLVIAHRLSTIRNADQILVMAGGRIVERGTWDALIDHGGVFARLHAAQHPPHAAT
jgi:ABC-type multidrug transport system fused ATPase/permease subunit